jgi:hypothetical protein
MVAPPGATFQNNINDLIFISWRYACEIQKHTTRTLFRVFECLDSGVQHCVRNLVKEHSSSREIFCPFGISFRGNGLAVLAFSHFFCLDAFEQSFEIAFPEAVVTFSLNELEEDGANNSFGEYL